MWAHDHTRTTLIQMHAAAFAMLSSWSLQCYLADYSKLLGPHRYFRKKSYNLGFTYTPKCQLECCGLEIGKSERKGKPGLFIFALWLRIVRGSLMVTLSSMNFSHPDVVHLWWQNSVVETGTGSEGLVCHTYPQLNSSFPAQSFQT